MPRRRRRRRAQRGARRLTASGDERPAPREATGLAAPEWLYAPGGQVRAVWRLSLFVLALVASFSVVMGIASATGVSSDWLAVAAALIAHLVAMRFVERRPWRDLGLGARALGPRLLGTGALIGALAVGVPSAVLVGTRLLRVEPMPDGSWWGVAGALAVKLAPLAFLEELLFRGYPFLVLRESAGPLVALALTSVVFGLAHLQNPGVTATPILMVVLAGVLLGGVLLVTGSLWAAFAAHLAWNWTLSAIVHAAVSGLPFAMPDYRTVDAGPDWLTGGAWGPEGGMAAGLGMLSAIALLWWRRSPLTLTARGPGVRDAAGEHTDG